MTFRSHISPPSSGGKLRDFFLNIGTPLARFNNTISGGPKFKRLNSLILVPLMWIFRLNRIILKLNEVCKYVITMFEFHYFYYWLLVFVSIGHHQDKIYKKSVKIYKLYYMHHHF